MNTILELFTGIGWPKLIEKLSVCVIIFTTGMLVGQHWETSTAIDSVLDHSSRDFAKASGIFIDHEKASNKKIAEAGQRNLAADETAHTNYQAQIDHITAAKTETEKKLSAALSNNAQLKDQTNGLMA